MYTTATDVYRIAGITSEEISEADVNEHILDAEAMVDAILFTTCWAQEDSGDVSSATTTTISDSTKNWTDDYTGYVVEITAGTGSGQLREVTASTTVQLTVSDWDTNPDATSDYKLWYVGSYNDKGVVPKLDELRDGDATDTIFTDKYPIVKVESITINSTEVTASSVYTYDYSGKIKTSSSSEVKYWSSSYPQDNEIVYWYGIKPIERLIKQLTGYVAARNILVEQMGGTFDTPATFQIPEMSGSIGQAYINIKSTVDMIQAKIDAILKRLPIKRHLY